MHVLITGDRNVIKRRAENILKYKDLTTEIQRMWNVKAAVTPVIIEGEWNHFRITQTLPEQHTGEVRNYYYIYYIIIVYYYNEPVFILMLRGRVGCLRQPTLPLSIRVHYIAM